jgi:hypothetical protein
MSWDATLLGFQRRISEWSNLTRRSEHPTGTLAWGHAMHDVHTSTTFVVLLCVSLLLEAAQASDLSNSSDSRWLPLRTSNQPRPRENLVYRFVDVETLPVREVGGSGLREGGRGTPTSAGFVAGATAPLALFLLISALQQAAYLAVCILGHLLAHPFPFCTSRRSSRPRT